MSSPLDAATIRRAMRVSTLEGLFGVQYVTLTTATVLTGFLLALGATAAQIGFVAMLPLLGGLLQPVGASLVRRRGGWRKGVVLTGMVTDALLWSVTLAAALWLAPAQALVVAAGVLVFQQAMTALNVVAWTSWMSDLIPATLRGRYFGRRNFICNALGAVTAVAAGQFVGDVEAGEIERFAVVIAAAVGFRLVGAAFMRVQPEPFPEAPGQARFREALRAPWRHDGFRRLLVFSMAWGFTVNLAAPFFTVYMIRDLRLDFGVVTLFAGFATVANLAGQRFWGPLCDRYGNQQVMRFTALVILGQPFWWLFAEAGGVVFVGALQTIGGFAWAGYLLGSANLMMGLAPAEDKTSFFAMNAAAAGLAGAFGSVGGGLLLDRVLPVLALPAWLPAGIPLLFLLSFGLRLGAWGLLHRVPEPTAKPRLRAVYLLNDFVRTFNVAQGFSPLLQRFLPDPADPPEETSGEPARRDA